MGRFRYEHQLFGSHFGSHLLGRLTRLMRSFIVLAEGSNPLLHVDRVTQDAYPV